MIDFSNITETTKIYIIVGSGIASMVASTFPFANGIQKFIQSYEDNQGQFRKKDVFMPVINQLKWTVGFIVFVLLIDFGGKLDIELGGNSGAIAQFWNNDYYLLMGTVEENGKEYMAFFFGALTKLIYPIGIFLMFLSYTYPFLEKAVESKTREFQNNNLNIKWFMFATTIAYVLGGASIYFVAYSILASFSMFHEGLFTPYSVLGRTFLDALESNL